VTGEGIVRERETEREREGIERYGCTKWPRWHRITREQGYARSAWVAFD
jgi:hypothetical protein